MEAYGTPASELISPNVQMHQWVKEDTRKVKLMKMSKGWQWEITYEHIDSQKLLDEIDWLNNELKKRYGEDNEPRS